MHGLLLLRVSQDVHSRRSGGVVAGGTFSSSSRGTYNPTTTMFGRGSTKTHFMFINKYVIIANCDVYRIVRITVICTELYTLL